MEEVEQMIDSTDGTSILVLEGLEGIPVYAFTVFFSPFLCYTVTTKLISTLHEEVQNIVMYICIFIFAHYLPNLGTIPCHSAPTALNQ